MFMKLFLIPALVAVCLGFSIQVYSHNTDEFAIDTQTEITAEDGDQVLVFTNKMGTVSFNHTKHQSAFACGSCHPPFEQKYDDAVLIKDAAHQTCKTCHAANNGPTVCKDCHKK